jgi:diaminopimelate decarboxylase
MTNYTIFDDNTLAEYALVNNISTPCYLYDKNLLDDTFNKASLALDKHFKNAFIHYAVKANHNQEIIEYAKKYNMGIDCVSGGEVKRALDEGVESSHIVFAGVGKADWEIELALDADMFAFNSESVQEIEVINELAKKQNKIAKICLRINPNIDAQTYHYISTGQFDDKFGIGFVETVEWLQSLASGLANIQIIGLHYHVGSQILNNAVFKELVTTVNEHISILKDLSIKIEHINFGGGLGIDYDEPKDNPIADFDSYFENIATNFIFKDELTVHFELGRSLVAQAGVLLSKVLFTKTTGNTDFAIIDAGMTELIRPALYQAKHKIVALAKDDSHLQPYHVVGPICESSDVFAKALMLPSLKRGDFVVIYSAGAYGKVLASEYNLRPTVQEYFI